MRDEPQGRFVMRTRGKAVKAKRYHLYKDCGLLAYSDDPESDIETINLDVLGEEESTATTVLDLLGLTVCSPCKNRSEEVSAEDVLAEMLRKAVTTPARDLNIEWCDGVAAEQVAALEAAGYKIRRVRRGGA